MARQMKDSGIEWIGEIPESWQYTRLKMFFSFEKGKNAAIYTQEYMGEHLGQYPVYSGQTEKQGIMGCIESFDYEICECLFTTTVGAKVMTPRILHGKFSLSQNCLIMLPRIVCCIGYFYYALLSLFDYEKSLIPSYMQPSLRIEDLRKYSLFVPALDEQQRIADFLDRKCAEIDAVIERTKVTIEEYKKLKQAVITEAVTKGVRGPRPMKDSGIEWIGEIPEEWDVVKAKYCVQITHGTDPQTEGDIPVYGSGAESFKTCGEYKEGPVVLVGRKGATLHIPHYIEGRYWNVDTAFDVKTNEKYLLRMYYYVAICFDYKYYMSQTTLPGMTQSNYNNMGLPCPSVSEQAEIVTYLDEKCAALDTLIAKKTALLTELETYKKSLIYEYVTGKKEVK